MSKRIHFYATEDDQRAIEQIQAMKPHWQNVNFILREGLHLLLKSLSTTMPQSPQGLRYIKDV